MLIDELKQKFVTEENPLINDSLHGESLVIPGKKIEPEPIPVEISVPEDPPQDPAATKLPLQGQDIPEAKVSTGDVLNDLENKFQAISEAYDLQSKEHVELREDFEAYVKMQSEITEAYRQELTDLTTKIKELQRALTLHKHNRSGEALTPINFSQ